MKEFLNLNMLRNQRATSTRFKKFLHVFPRATNLVAKKLGEKPFHVRGPLNSSALDSVLAIIVENFDKLPKDIDRRYEKLLKDEDFHETTYYGTSDIVVLQKRFEIATQYLLGK